MPPLKAPSHLQPQERPRSFLKSLGLLSLLSDVLQCPSVYPVPMYVQWCPSNHVHRVSSFCYCSRPRRQLSIASPKAVRYASAPLSSYPVDYSSSSPSPDGPYMALTSYRGGYTPRFLLDALLSPQKPDVPPLSKTLSQSYNKTPGRAQ